VYDLTFLDFIDGQPFHWVRGFLRTLLPLTTMIPLLGTKRLKLPVVGTDADRATGALMGLAMGDALGAQIEFYVRCPFEADNASSCTCSPQKR
jgi:hypothetical protein